MKIRTIKQIRNLKNKRVLVRVDFNVPVKNNKVVDDARILAALPTLQYLIKNNAKIILVTHFGRPKGAIVPELRVAPIAKRLSELLKDRVSQLTVSTGQKVEKAVKKLKRGHILFLENIQFEPGETTNDSKLAKVLASYADYYITDNFAQSHRKYASISAVAKYIPAYAGLLLEKETVGLSKAIEKPKKPFVLVLGGAKMETKLPVLKNLLPKADYILIGGGIFNTYLKAKGFNVGKSLVDNDYLKEALKYCGAKKVIKPVDVVVGKENGEDFKVMKIDKEFEIGDKRYVIFDIGPETIRLYAQYIRQAQTIVWNGAMGYFEQKPYDVGTLSIARLVASRSKGKAFGIIGGGETLQAMEKVKMTEFVDLVSTGGGAMLDFLAGDVLPGIKVVSK